jgi:RNA polymerase sigma factor (sigma-70 family)
MNTAALPGSPLDSPLDQLIGGQLRAAADGDRAAYGRIVAACQNTVTAIALAITRDVSASEDIAQEAFLSAWQNLRRLHNPASFLPWLRQITRNLAHDHLRGRQRRSAEVAGAEDVIAMVADPQPTPFEQLLDHEQQRVAADLISALPDESREVLLLYYREGQSSRQVALLLGLSDAAVRKRLSRARQVVREDLLARFGEFAQASAPALAFTTMVATALTVASPPAAATGLLSVGAAAGAKTLGKVLLGAAGSLGFALMASFAGIFLGLRQQLKGTIDQEERDALIRASVVSGLVSLGFMGTLLMLGRFDDGWLLPVLATLVFMAIVLHKAVIVQPRILARRHALEAQRDPVAAAPPDAGANAGFAGSARRSVLAAVSPA